MTSPEECAADFLSHAVARKRRFGMDATTRFWLDLYGVCASLVPRDGRDPFLLVIHAPPSA